ncbi:MAG: Flp pilus assembly protein CpaB [Planctomycetota bacterium]|jgi:pilus assembly protein CpaB
MKGRAIVPLVLGLCVGLVAVKYLVDTLQDAKGSTTESETISVVRATRDIDSFQKITLEFVELVETTDPTLAPSQERITSIEDVVGRVTAKAVPERAPILQSMLAPPDTPPGMVGRIPPGFRAVAVKIDEVTGVAYQLKPGSWVDVIVVMDVNSSTGRGGRETIAEVVLQRVQVAAIGRSVTRPSEGAGSKMKPAKSATLFVADRDVPKLHLAATRGKLTLAMRGDDRQTTAEPLTARGSEVFAYGRENTPAPDPRPPAAAADLSRHRVTVADPPHSLVVYRGSTQGDSLMVEQIIFEDSGSRNIVGVGISPISRVGGSRVADEWGPAPSQGRNDRSNGQEREYRPDSHNMEGE